MPFLGWHQAAVPVVFYNKHKPENPPNTSRHVIISCFTVSSVCLIDHLSIEESQLYMLLIKSRGFMDIYYGTPIDWGHAAQPRPSAEKQIWPCWHISQRSPDRLIKSHWCPPAWENGFIFRGIHPQGKKIKINGFLCSATVCNCVCEGDCFPLGNVIYANVTWKCINRCSQNDFGLIESLWWSLKAEYRLKY